MVEPPGWTALGGGLDPGALDRGVVETPGEVRAGDPGVDEADPEPCKTWISCKASANCFWRFPTGSGSASAASLGRHQIHPKNEGDKIKA